LQVEPIDLTALVAVIMGTLTVLIPIAGVTARFALKPLVETVTQCMQAHEANEAMELTERRIELMEQRIDTLEAELRRVREVGELDAALWRSTASPALDVRPSIDAPSE